MASERKPNAPFDPDHRDNPAQNYIAESPAQLDQDLQIDPELGEGPASSTRIALLTIGIAIVLGAVFYGLNNSSLHQQNAATAPPPATAQNSASTSLPTPPPGMHDLTPRGNNAANNAPGTTTGSAPASK